MSNKIIFSGGRTIDSVAWDLALNLAARDTSIKTPEELLEKIAELLPECVQVAETRKSVENPPLVALDVLSF